ncbi:MAG TPA: hypothetical protein VMD97_04275 [Candidatus Aquilonibacter sp.]|nr:hypothetical protein [Candidatus Aquilonibacter sp.]
MSSNVLFHMFTVSSMSLSKRGVNGTYVAVAPMRLDRHFGEQKFRFNCQPQ